MQCTYLVQLEIVFEKRSTAYWEEHQQLENILVGIIVKHRRSVRWRYAEHSLSIEQMALMNSTLTTKFTTFLIEGVIYNILHRFASHQNPEEVRKIFIKTDVIC